MLCPLYRIVESGHNIFCYNATMLCPSIIFYVQTTTMLCPSILFYVQAATMLCPSVLFYVQTATMLCPPSDFHCYHMSAMLKMEGGKDIFLKEDHNVQLIAKF